MTTWLLYTTIRLVHISYYIQSSLLCLLVDYCQMQITEGPQLETRLARKVYRSNP